MILPLASVEYNWFGWIKQEKERRMGESMWSIVKWLVCGLILIWVWKFFNWVWLKPKRAEKSLRQQGLKGNSYRFLIGDLKETSRLRNEAKKKTLPFTNDFFSHLFPFHQQHFNKYGLFTLLFCFLRFCFLIASCS